MNQKHVVVFGGGTGVKALLEALAGREDVRVSVLIGLVDDGGSTGVLREELGVSPAGDVRNAIAALSPDSLLKRAVLHRFSEGVLKGHNLGNILMAGMEQEGSLAGTIEELERMMGARGHVIAVTNGAAVLSIETDGKVIRGEDMIQNSVLGGTREVIVEPSNDVNPEAVAAIGSADLLVIGPGSLYEALISSLVLPGISEAIGGTDCPIVYNCNHFTVPGHTDGFTVQDFAREIQRHLPRPITHVIYHDGEVPEGVLRQQVEGSQTVKLGEGSVGEAVLIGTPLMMDEAVEQHAADVVKRSRISGDGSRLAELLIELL
jgi:uncharacterized cofD-like protein